jgi:photosystem II stability/assembly factor-like uncharacterized protein
VVGTAAGCGSSRPFVSRVHTHGEAMTFTDRVRLLAGSPALAPGAVAFLDAREGFLATTGGGQWIPKVGWERPRQPARIQRTTDGGVTWRIVWSKPGIVLTGLSFARDARHASATGTRSPMTGGYGSGPVEPRDDVTVTTADGGRTWRIGRGPQPASLVRGQSGRTVYEAIDPQTATRIRRSDDGGRTWRTVLDLRGRRRRWVPIERLGVVDPLHVWAVSYENSQGFDFFDVHVTDDGGLHWARRRVPALPSAFAPGGRAWAVDGATAAVWRTLDEGRTWRVSTSPRAVATYAVDIATPRELDIATSVGELRSDDGGRAWRPVPRATERAAALRNRQLAYVPPGNGYSERALVRRGEGWVALHPPGLFTFGDASFTDDRHGLVADGNASGEDVRARVYRTRDGGASWTRVRLPPGASGADVAAIGPDTVVVEHDGQLLVSVDDGGSWSDIRVALHYPECSVQRPKHTTWILCSDVIGHRAGTRSVLLRTVDGRSWRALGNRRTLAHAFRATSDDEAWAVSWNGDPGGVPPLWHTTDGGATWQRVAAAPRPDAPVVYRLLLPR